MTERSATGTFSPLMRASAIGHEPRVVELIKEGVDVNEKGPRDSTALMFAAGGGHFEIVRVLVEHGADIAAKEAGGWDARAHAEADGHEEVAVFLSRVSRFSKAFRKQSHSGHSS